MISCQEEYLDFAASHYTYEQVLSEHEFRQDLNKISSVKRIITSYNNKKDANLKILINNMICLLNTFEYKGLIELLSYKFENNMSFVYSTILFLNRLKAEHTHLINQEFLEVLKRNV